MRLSLALRLSLACLLAAGLGGCLSRSFGPYVSATEFAYKDGASERWADLSPDFALCRDGQRQSPIDLVDIQATPLEPARFDYRPSSLHMRHDGHTLRIDIDPGSFLEVEGTRYELKEMHFHRISGHAINGQQFPLEAHLMHESSRGRLLVLAVLIKYGSPSWQLNTLIRNLPEDLSQEVHIPDIHLDLDDFLGRRQAREFYMYEGSLTVPPCTEGVRWLVMRNIAEASRVQQYKFRELVPGNYRPLQPANGRRIDHLPAPDAGSE